MKIENLTMGNIDINYGIYVDCCHFHWVLYRKFKQKNLETVQEYK